MKKIVMSSCIFMFLLCGILQATEPQQITIIYTNSTNGTINYCHCKSDPNGGLVKRATEFKRIKKEFPGAFFFDSGDFFLYEEDELLSKYLVKAYQYMGYDAITCGDQEFTLGIERFLKIGKALPILCNSIQVKRGGIYAYPFKRTAIINKNGIRIGVIGTISEKAFQYYDRKITGQMRISDQISEIKKDIIDLEAKNPSLIVLLSHSGFERDKEIARSIPRLDLIIGGHSQNLVDPPYKSGSTIIVQAGMNGAHIGILNLYRTNTTIKYKNSFRVPDDRSPDDDPYIRGLIREYQQESSQKFGTKRFE